MDALLWLIPALPLAGFVVLVAGGKRLGDPLAGIVATLMTTASFVVGLIVFGGLVDKPADARAFEQSLFTWIPAGDFSVDVGFLADPLSITWVLFVTGIAALIHVYSIGYMRGDPRFHTYFAYLNLFVFSMLMLVLGNNLLITFLGWEGVGACSYFLISFWFEKNENATAGKKAFVTNRIGDWGFLVAMFLTFTTFGSLQYTEVLPLAPGLTATTATAIAALFFVGAVGKSAQLPLFVWLPDAMAGPTPVSALIHAATMVTAGVYLMVRINPILGVSYEELGLVIAWIGVATALVAATVALAQNDIKKVLAYSTISQLGFMFAAVGVGAYVAAVFHVVTHAFFKALLFLGSGSVIHGVHDEQDMRRMGGLRKWMPITSVTFLIGVLAIAGIPPLAGFWSKDEILLAEYDESIALAAVLMVTAFLTAVYMTRQYVTVFTGKPRFDEHEVHPHESGWLMTVPLIVLAGLTLVGGALNLPFLSSESHFLQQWLEPVVPFETHLTLDTGMKVTIAVMSALTALAGAIVGWVVYRRRAAQADVTEPAMLERAWYIDWAYSKVVDGPGRMLFDAAAWFDRRVIDGAVNGVGWVARGTGSNLRTVQNGLVRSYAMVVAIGAFLLVGYVLTRMSF
jgi:NADH-quinone oxidoreductase subunit L